MQYLFSLLFLVFFMIPKVYAQEVQHVVSGKYVEVTGIAELEITPNEIYLNITIIEEKEDLKRSVEEQEDLLISKLKKLDVDIKNLKLSNVGSFSYWSKKDKKSYKQKSFELKLEDAGKASEVMYELNSLEIYIMNVARTDHSEIEMYKKQVKIDAVKAAKEKASYLLEAVDQKLGPVIYIIEKENYYGYYRSVGALANTSHVQQETYAPSQEIEFQPINLKYNILARFEIK